MASEDRDAVIRTDNLTRMFDQVMGVKALSMDVQAGEIFGLVGPDGAGKTTTIRLLAALMDPTEGEAHVLGYDTVHQAEAIKGHIGYMAQRFNLYSDLSVWENLNFFADVFQVWGETRRERLERLLEFARLGAFRDRRVEHLSGGMQKKLALACTLVHRPDIVFLDEPTTGVDPLSRRELWDILAELHVQGVTLLISTPYMDEAERCSRVGLMYQGEMIMCDTPEQIKAMIQGELIVLWPTQVRRAREILWELPDVLELQIFGDQLRVFVQDAEAILDEIRETLKRHGIDIQDVQRGEPRMEEAFVSLIRQQRER
ncbi:MAG: ABC transporter ATP-binding protein [Anaerolineales bacterium]